MAQISYRNPRTRTYSEHPQPTGPLLLTTAMNPGAAAEFDALFTDGSTAVADEAYLREKILEPMKRRVTTGMVEMPSYRGVLTDAQIESLVLYIKTLSSRGEDAGRPAGGE